MLVIIKHFERTRQEQIEKYWISEINNRIENNVKRSTSAWKIAFNEWGVGVIIC